MATPLNVVSASNTAATTTISIPSYVVPAALNKRLIVGLNLFLVNTVGGGIVSTSLTVTFNGTPMNLQKSSTSNNTNGGSNGESSVYLFDLPLGSTTPTGDIVANWSTTQTHQVVILAYVISDVEQGATLGTTPISSQSLGSDSISSTTTSTIIDLVCNNSQHVSGNYSVVPNSGQTAIINLRVLPGSLGENNFASSYVNSPSGPNSVVGWSGTTSVGPRAQHIVVAYNSSGTVSVITSVALLLMGIG